MPPKPLTPVDHFARHCGYQKLEIVDGEIVGVFPEAFELRPAEGYLSGSWPEYFAGERLQRLSQTVAAMRSAGRKLSSNSAIAEINVGGMLTCAKNNFGRSLRALHEPERGAGNDAYATIRGMQDDAPLDFLFQVFVANQVSVTRIGDLEDPTSTPNP